MHLSFFGLALIVAILGLSLLTGFVTTWRRFSGKRLITCPESLTPEAVDVNGLAAAKNALVHGTPNPRLTSCSRWPEREDCGQECLAQIETSPEGCLVRNIVASWYAGKRCVLCHRAIGEIVWHEQPPALLAPNGSSAEWKDIAPQDLPALFRGHQPLCWSCHTALAFRREHRELVIERPRRTAAHPVLRPTTAVY